MAGMRDHGHGVELPHPRAQERILGVADPIDGPPPARAQVAGEQREEATQPGAAISWSR